MYNRGGIVVGPSHKNGGVPFVLQDTGRPIEEEGMEINIPRDLAESDTVYTIKGTNAQVLDKILSMAGLSISDKVTNRSGDVVICVRSAWDDQIRTFTGTVTEILHKINTSKGCKPIIGGKATVINKKGGKLPKSIKQRVKDWQTENPNSPRWKKKKARIEELSNSIQGLRMTVSKDIQQDDERIALTALVVAVMDRTAERIGNDDSADNGHFGVTGFRKKHISVLGNKVHLDYVGKSGTKHEKSFSDARIAKALKTAIKNAPGKFIFETSDGFRIKSDKVNRYLEPFKISAKDMRGYNANRWIIELLKKNDGKVTADNPEKAKKERKTIFNKAVKETAIRVGHGSGTLKKHYMIPELPTQYIEHGRIIDMKNLGYYMEGSIIESKNSNQSNMKTVNTSKEQNERSKLHDEFMNQALKKIRVIYQFNHSRMGFENSITVDAFNSEDAIEKAKKEVSDVYGSKMLKRFSFKTYEISEGGKLPCPCFSSYLKTNYSDLSEQLCSIDVNTSAELRTQVDKAYKEWQSQ